MSENTGNPAPSPSQQPQPDQGGSGGVVQPSDLVMYSRALRHDWPISPAMRELAVANLVAILATSKKHRTIISATKVLGQLDAMNAKREANDIREQNGKRRPLVATGRQSLIEVDPDKFSSEALEAYRTFAAFPEVQALLGEESDAGQS